MFNGSAVEAAARFRMSAYERRLCVLTMLAMLFACVLFALTSASSIAAEAQTANQKAKPAQKQTQRPFSSPAEAMEAFAAAVKAGDVSALNAMLGREGQALLESGDPAGQRSARERFTAAYAESHKLQERGLAKAWIVVGKDEWPMPIPLVKRGSAWYFDTRAGKEEVLNRRIGRNELAVQQVMLAYVDAQNEYYSRNPTNDKLLHYAQKFVSSSGARDGLYFQTKAGEKPSPLGPLFEARKAAGYVEGNGGQPAPYFGYRYVILKAQGPNAPGGAYNYVVNGKMIGGFALIAYPASYGNSGVMTFMVNHDGVVYEKNLGRDTASIAGKMTRFDPDKTWKRRADAAK